LLAFVLACAGGCAGEVGTSAPSSNIAPPPPPSANPCVAPQGTPVHFEVRRIDLGSSPPARDAGSPPGDARIVKLRNLGTGAKVSWVVETATEVVVGFFAPAYCSGVPPREEEQFEVVLPASTKPARTQYCSSACSGPPLP
jgi:hypothetical protein